MPRNGLVTGSAEENVTVREWPGGAVGVGPGNAETAILTASRSISRGLAFGIFVGTTSLHGVAARAFTTGRHAAFYASVGFMVLAAVLSAIRAKGKAQPARATQD